MFVPPLMKIAHSALGMKEPGTGNSKTSSSSRDAPNDNSFAFGSGLEETGNPVLALWTLRSLVSFHPASECVYLTVTNDVSTELPTLPNFILYSPHSWPRPS